MEAGRIQGDDQRQKAGLPCLRQALEGLLAHCAHCFLLKQKVTESDLCLERQLSQQQGIEWVGIKMESSQEVVRRTLQDLCCESGLR